MITPPERSGHSTAKTTGVSARRVVPFNRGRAAMSETGKKRSALSFGGSFSKEGKKIVIGGMGSESAFL